MKAIISLLMIILLASCGPGIKKDVKNNDASQNQVNNSTRERLQDSLAFSLCQIYGFDQYVRPNGVGRINWDAVHHADSITFEKLVAFVKDNGFPTKQLVGDENFSHECVAMAAVVVLLHNPHRLVNEEEHLNLFIGEVKKGNLKAESLATILDKYYWSKKGNDHRVLYGSQFGMPCAAMKEETNAARMKIGLTPLADSLFVKCD